MPEAIEVEHNPEVKLAEDKYIVIGEHETISTPYHEEDELYLKKDGVSGSHPRYSGLIYQKSGNNAIITNSGLIGDLLLPSGIHIHLQSKSNTEPLDIYNYAKDVITRDTKRLLYYDIKNRPDVPKGAVFFEFLGRVFLDELEKFREYGFVREYVEKNENINYLKGKLLVSKHIRQNYANPKFNVRYFDLTIDNFHNQMILYSAHELIQMVSDFELKGKLYHHVEELKDQITLLPVITPSEVYDVQVTRKNLHYEEILHLSKMVITKTFYQYEGDVDRGFNYLLDMNVVFERAVYKLFKKLLPLHNIEDQRKYRNTESFVTLPDYKSLKLIPDIIVSEGLNEVMVIDAKYKRKIQNTDYYQLIVYSEFLRMKSKKLKTAMFVNYMDDESTEPVVIMNGSINLSNYSEGEDIKLKKITLNINQYSFEELEEALKLKLGTLV